MKIFFKESIYNKIYKAPRINVIINVSKLHQETF